MQLRTKIKSFLLIGNLFNVQFNSKNQNRAGYFKVEIEKIYTPHFLEDKIKLNCILYSLNLVKILTVENQSNINLYEQFNKLYEILNEEDWIKKFIFWELEVIKLVGYDINFNEYVDINDLKNNKLYVKTSDGSKEIPFFIKSDNTKINNDLLKMD